MSEPSEPLRRLVVIGAAGDLTSRLLLPAVAELHRLHLLPDGFRVIAADVIDMTTDEFRQHVDSRFNVVVPNMPRGNRTAVLGMLDYRRVDVNDPQSVADLLRSQEEPVALYLALPPRLSEAAVRSLAQTGTGAGSRLVVEKPFGEDLTSAKRLNKLVHSVVPESSVFRVDHFLGKQTVRNIIGLRFGNRMFEPIWNALHIERVDIFWDETLTIEGRRSYDEVGALRDMIQNHLMQLVCLIAMESPRTLDEADLRGGKAEVVRALRRPTRADVRRLTVRGRYGAGVMGTREVPAYVDEPGIKAANATETFAQVTLFIENWRWAGVPVTLRTGKALRVARQEIVVTFKPVPHMAFTGTVDPGSNALHIGLDPDRLSLDVNITGHSEEFTLDPVTLELDMAPQFPPPYGLLLMDVLQGDPTLSIRDDEIEGSWEVIDRIMLGWKEGVSPLIEYPAGSDGPLPTSRRRR